MPIFQTFNPKTKAFVKYKFKSKNGRSYPEFFDVKQRMPQVPFKGIKIR